MSVKPLRKEVFPVIIYALSCPDTKTIKYIGKTQLSISKRFSLHINSKRGRSNSRIWITELKSKGKLPIISILEITNSKWWNNKEKYWIEKYKGNRLLNHNKGGGGNHSTKTNVLDSFKLFLNENSYSNNSKKNYAHCVSLFLRKHSSGTPDPQKINSKTIKKYIDSILNYNTQKTTITALKLFYSQIINQPKKFRQIKYKY